VVEWHAGQAEAFPGSPYQQFVNAGWLGVTVFFVVSGFSIQRSALHSSALGDFLRRRFWRIYPPYLVSVGVVLAIVLLRKGLTGTNDLAFVPRDIPAWLATLTLTTKPVTSIPTVNWVYWSLSYECAFYFISSLPLIKRALKWPFLFSITLLACTLSQHPPAALFFVNQWSFFALGVGLAEWEEERSILPIILILLCLADFFLNQTMLQAIAAIAALLTCIACLHPWGAWLNRERVLHHVGEWSYSLYLLHVPIGAYVLLRVIGDFRYLGYFAHICTDFGILLFCIGCSSVFCALVERPSQRRGMLIRAEKSNRTSKLRAVLP
jgi:peptidoglycan/LPS O-acetylase OafA/YrhL